MIASALRHFGGGWCNCLFDEVAGSSLWHPRTPLPPRRSQRASGNVLVATNVCRGGTGIDMRRVSTAEVRNAIFQTVARPVPPGQRR